MNKDRHNSYCNIPFSPEICHGDFYIYGNVKDLANRCEESHEELLKCRTVGILNSMHGKFFLSDMDVSGVQSCFNVQVSMVYLRTPLKSTVIPYPIQVFGTLQWKNRPVIFAKIIQILNIPMAIRIRDIMSNITQLHLARKPHPQE